MTNSYRAPDGFRGSALWQRAFAEGLAARERDAAGHLEHELFAAREKTALLLGRISADLPWLTVHDITHIDALWQIASEIVGPDFRINPAEAYVFGAALLLHDAALTLASYPDGIAGLQREPEWRDTLVLEFRKRGVESPSEDQLTEPPVEIAQHTIFSVIRARHATQARLLPRIEFNGAGYLFSKPELREFYADAIGRIAESHWHSVAQLDDFLPRQVAAMGEMPSEWSVDPVKFACLLRVADAAHLDGSRAPRFLRELVQPSGTSLNHWIFQEKLGKVVRNGDALCYASGPEFSLAEADAWWMCFDAVTQVDRELRAVDRLLEETNRPRFAARHVRAIHDPMAFSRFVRTSGWHPVDARLQVSDVPDLVRRLGGRHLYGEDPSIAVREAIQNAADAIHARRLLEGRDDDFGEIVVELVESEVECTLIVRDNGIGMSERVLVGPLLDFGRSFWSSALVQTEFPGLIGKGLAPTGRFGIGFFAAFMLGDVVTVRSRRPDAAADATHVLEFRRGLKSRPILRPAEMKEIMRDAGTEVGIVLSQNPRSRGGLLALETYGGKVNSLALRSVVAALCPNLGVNVSVIERGKRSQALRANDWIRIPGQKLFSRVERSSPVSREPSAADNIYAANIRPIQGKDGKLYGRASITGGDRYFSNAVGVITVGGLAAARVRHLRGVMVGRVDNMARDKAIPTVPAIVLSAWATEQGELIEKSSLSNREKLRAAGVIMAYGGDVGNLPIVEIGGRYLGRQELIDVARESTELVVYTNETVDYDADLDSCHPKAFDDGFDAADDIAFVSRWNADVSESKAVNWPRNLFPDTLTYIRVVENALRDAWGGFEESMDERAVGTVDEDDITRDVTIYRRKSD